MNQRFEFFEEKVDLASLWRLLIYQLLNLTTQIFAQPELVLLGDIDLEIVKAIGRLFLFQDK